MEIGNKNGDINRRYLLLKKLTKQDKNQVENRKSKVFIGLSANSHILIFHRDFYLRKIYLDMCGISKNIE